MPFTSGKQAERGTNFPEKVGDFGFKARHVLARGQVPCWPISQLSSFLGPVPSPPPPHHPGSRHCPPPLPQLPLPEPNPPLCFQSRPSIERLTGQLSNNLHPLCPCAESTVLSSDFASILPCTPTPLSRKGHVYVWPSSHSGVERRAQEKREEQVAPEYGRP